MKPTDGLKGVPYPTFLHPASDLEMTDWIKYVRSRPRTRRLVMAAGYRPGRIREVDLCNKTAGCTYIPRGHYSEILTAYLEADFCLQPRGDSPSRRGLFDSLLCGCIPVVVDPRSADYPAHITPNVLRKVVLFAANTTQRKLSLEEVEAFVTVPLTISPRELAQRREIVFSLIPSLAYGRLGWDAGAFGKALGSIVPRRGNQVQLDG